MITERHGSAMHTKGIDMNRAEVLDTAKGYVTQDRAADHGDMEDNFGEICSGITAGQTY